MSYEEQRIVKAIVKLLVDDWLPFELDMRIRTRLPFAIVDGERLPNEAVVFHDPGAIR